MELTINIERVSNGTIVEVNSGINGIGCKHVTAVCQSFNDLAFDNVEDIVLNAVKKIYRETKEAERANDKPATQSEEVVRGYAGRAT